jgi:L-amino acid N-acyltransferase YncA
MARDGSREVCALMDHQPRLATIDHRRAGLARRLYEHFEEIARAHGTHALKAITKPVNARSIAFHHALGFAASERVDYGGPGQPRTVLWKEISSSEGHAPAEITARLSD